MINGSGKSNLYSACSTSELLLLRLEVRKKIKMEDTHLF